MAPTAFRAIKREDPTVKRMGKDESAGLRMLFLAGERRYLAHAGWAQKQLGVPVIDHCGQTETGRPIGATLYRIGHAAGEDWLVHESRAGDDVRGDLEYDGTEITAGRRSPVSSVKPAVTPEVVFRCCGGTMKVIRKADPRQQHPPGDHLTVMWYKDDDGDLR